MNNYLRLCKHVLLNGEKRMDRTGTGTLSLFATSLKFDLSQGYPLVTTKYTHYPAIWHELLWFLKGTPYITYLKENGVRIWNEWADENDWVGRIYGVQWRGWRKHYWKDSYLIHSSKSLEIDYIDQLQNAIDTIKANPTDRRMLVTAWNPGELDEANLPPCHYAYQFYVRQGKYLDIMVHQRSADLFLGVPFDIASYATLCHMVAYLTNLRPGILAFTFGDTHIYLNHIDQVKEMLTREPYPLPLFYIDTGDDEVTTIDDFKFHHFRLEGYVYHPAIKGKVSI